MKFEKAYKFYIYFLTFFVILATIFAVFFFSQKKEKIVSPLPKFLNKVVNNQVSTLNLWIPFFDMFEGKSEEVPQISAESALVYDITDDKTLFAKDPEKKLPMASLTKIMTAIISLENPKKDDKYLVSDEDLVGENSMGLSEGEILSQKELMYGLLLLSGNDAAEVLANNFPKGREEFIKSMNNKAKSLGLKNTNFTNPTGFEGDGDQHTTTYDLLVMTKYAMKYSLFKNAVKTFEYEIPETSTHKYFYLQNETNLISSYPGVIGVKDGFTPEAGLCLVSYLDYKGHKIVGIVLGSDNRRQEMKDLLDYGLEIQGITPPPHS